MIESKGHLNPGDPGVMLRRYPLAAEFTDLVRHVWVARWQLRDGERRTQLVLTYPGCNAMFTVDGAALFGPAPRVDTRNLAGDGWAVGVLLQPAATHLMSPAPPRDLVGKNVPLPDAPWKEVTDAMAGGEVRMGVLTDTLQHWLAPYLQRVDDSGRLVNTICSLAESDEDLLTVAALAERAGVAQRTLHRLLTTRVGVSAKWLIERRKLQAAAALLRDDPELPLAALAAELGFADQAHFTKRFRAIVGFTPGQARSGAADDAT
jgi:AraC-like DNA-binding protein